MYRIVINTLISVFLAATHFKPHHLRDLSLLLQDVAGYWVAIANQLGMEPQVATIRRSPDNVIPSDCLKDLLDHWINQENPATLEKLCHVLSDCPEIVGGAGVAMKLKGKFQLQRGLQLAPNMLCLRPGDNPLT